MKYISLYIYFSWKLAEFSFAWDFWESF